MTIAKITSLAILAANHVNVVQKPQLDWIVQLMALVLVSKMFLETSVTNAVTDTKNIQVVTNVILSTLGTPIAKVYFKSFFQARILKNIFSFRMQL